MKKFLIVLFVAAAIICMLNEEPKEKTYTQAEMQEAIAEAERKAYKRGYEEGIYYAKGELERFKSEYGDAGYEEGKG